MKNKVVSSLIATVLINLSVLTLFILFLEFSYRTVSFYKSCLNKQCDLSKFKIVLESRNRWHMGISQYDKALGYTPVKNLIKVINAPGWDNVKVTTDEHGSRNSLNNQRSLPNVLTVGGSYTWGDQVNDKHTWQSCLNDKIDTHNFINAGVFGYGTAQSVLRAKTLFKVYKPKIIIIQTLVGYDLKRDQMDIRSGFIKPYLTISSKNKALLNKPIKKDTPNTKYGPSNYSFLDLLIANISLLQITPLGNYYSTAIDKLNGNLTRKAKKPASVASIMNWSAAQSLELGAEAIWLLQYHRKYHNYVAKERSIIIKTLDKLDIKYIDTFDVLHGANAKYPADEIWFAHHTPLGNKFGHHTPLGNKIVCNVIFNNLKLKNTS